MFPKRKFNSNGFYHLNLTHIQVVQIFFVLELMHGKSKDQTKVFSMDARKTTSEQLILFEKYPTGFFALPKNSGSLIGSLKYDRKRLKRSPLGASLVSLTPFCNIITGN